AVCEASPASSCPYHGGSLWRSFRLPLRRGIHVSLPLDQEPPRLRTRFTTRRPSTERGVSPTALMALTPPYTVAFGDLHSPTSGRPHDRRNVPAALGLQYLDHGVTVERFRHRRTPTAPTRRRSG